MAKINVTGAAVVITSAMKVEDLKTIAKYRPEALTLFGGEEGKTPLFKVEVTSGAGSINTYGAAFSDATTNAQGLAVITEIAKGVAGDVKEWAADKYGSIITKLNKIEATLPAVLDKIAEEKAAVMSNISVS